MVISHPRASLSDNTLQDSLTDEEDADDEGDCSGGDGDEEGDSEIENSTLIEDDMGLVEHEARRLSEVVEACLKGGMSSRGIELVLKARPLRSRCSYQSIMRWVTGWARMKRVRHSMCPVGHMVVEEDGQQCEVENCGRKSVRSVSFWRVPLTKQLQALARDREAFEKLRQGQQKVEASVCAPQSPVLFDYYDGELFRHRHTDAIRSASSRGELVVLLRMTTDGFKVFEGRRKQRSAWPIAFTVLNYDHKARFQASNVLITSFVPGSHDSDYFDTFLRPTVNEMLQLEQGVTTTCADGATRMLKAFVVFATGDMPAVSKLFGYAGHKSARPCRFCHFEATHDRSSRSMQSIPKEGEQDIRTSNEMTRLWEKVEVVRDKGVKAEYQRFVRRWGIKRRPALSSLMMDFTHGAPHDPMHLLLLGWVKHITVLLIGGDGRCLGKQCSHIIDDDAWQAINESLQAGSSTIPASWGRPPLDLAKLSSYKSEDWKAMGMYYGPALFNTKIVGPKVAQLWSMTSQMLHICFSPCPSRRDVETLRDTSEQSLKLFAEIFYQSDDHSFCFTPTTHYITHLHQNLQQCGPLTNVNQYVVERLIGQLALGVKSRKLPETQLLARYSLQFSLQALRDDNTPNSEGQRLVDAPSARLSSALAETGEARNDKMPRTAGKGSWVKVTGQRVRSLVIEWAVEGAGVGECDVGEIRSVPKLTVCHGESSFQVETASCFKKRKSKCPDARQRCFVAAHFATSDASGGSGGSENANSNDEVAVWYGRITNLLQVEVVDRKLETTSMCSADGFSDGRWRSVAIVEWESSACLDAVTCLPLSVRKQSRVWRGQGVSAIGLESVDRPLGYLEMEIGKCTTRMYIDTDYDHLQLGDVRSHYQLRSAVVK